MATTPAPISSHANDRQQQRADETPRVQRRRRCRGEWLADQRERARGDSAERRLYGGDSELRAAGPTNNGEQQRLEAEKGRACWTATNGQQLVLAVGADGGAVKRGGVRGVDFLEQGEARGK